MFIITNFLVATAQVLDFILWAYLWIIVARVVVSWVRADPHNSIVRIIYSATEPVLDRVRQVLPLYAGGFDFAPIVVWVAIIFLQRFLVRSLYDLASALR